MSQDFPPAGSEPNFPPPPPVNQNAFPPEPPAHTAPVFTPAQPQKKSNRTLIIILVVLLVLCLCCVAFTLFMYFVGGDWLLENLQLEQYLH